MEQAIVLDTNDKATSMKEKITNKNIIQNTIRSMRNRIGELSNLATRVWNRVPRNEEEKKKQKDYVDLLSTIVGKSIDEIKTGVLWLPPKVIAKTYRLVPYFMKYISPYYAKMKRFSYAHSNMNLLCRDIEDWERKLKRKTNQNSKSNSQPFDYTIMLDLSINWDAETYSQIEQLYQRFRVEFKELKKQQRMSYKSPEYYNYFSGYNQNDIKNTNVDWKTAFEKYKKESRKICHNQKELANYAVTLCYADDEKMSKEKNFAWIVAEDGIVANIKPQEIMLPVYDLNGEYEYLGKKYRLEPYIYDENAEMNDKTNDKSKGNDKSEDISYLEDDENELDEYNNNDSNGGEEINIYD